MPDIDKHSVHSVDFDPALSSEAPDKKHFSIDLSLELERQLDMETFPSTPTTTKKDEEPNQESLDPFVLAHIIKELRQSLEEVTKDRDELRQLIASSHANEAELRDTLQHMIDKATAAEVELTDARKKMKDDEEAISMLRSKVEESRRGLMRLQKENRRQSQTPPALDLSRSSFSSLGGPLSSKRASFVPLTGSLSARPNSHRRISSVSDSTPSSPVSQLHSSPESQPAASSRRHSAFFGRTSPIPPHEPVDCQTVEIESLRKDLQEAKEQLASVKHELDEATEAREASETCVKALRAFIDENDIGVSNPGRLKTSPPSAMEKGDEDDSCKTTATSSLAWGFKLWKDSPSRPTFGASQSVPMTTQTIASSSSDTSPTNITPLTRKIGEFFGSRNSVSSSSSRSLSPATAVPQLQTNAAMNGRDESYSASEASSLVEPLSPPDECESNVIVRDATAASDLTSTKLSVIDKDAHQMPITQPGGIASVTF